MVWAYAVAALLAALGVLQVAVACGAPWGRFVWGGQDDVLPPGKRLGSLIALVIYGGIAIVVFDRAGIVDVMYDRLAQVASWVVFAYLLLSIALNALSLSPSERRVMTPVSAVLAVLSLLVALGV